MKKFFCSAFVLFCLTQVWGAGRFVKLNTKNPADNEVIKISQISEKGFVTGNIKTLVFDLIITNSSDRVLEGEFEFPLEEGETVTGFALDINGKLRQASAVEKEKGRQVFEDIERRGIDPGLIEKTEGNNFKTRVYPVPAKGFRQIQITCQRLLGSSSPEAKKNLIFTQTLGKETYFYVVPEIEKHKTAKKKLPESVAVYFDVSDSSNNRKIELELSILSEYIKATGAKKLSCVTFSNTIHQRKNFERYDDLILFLKNQKFDGGTSLNLELDKEKADSILIFSDGIENSGSFKKTDLSDGQKTKITGIISSDSYNSERLKNSCGMVINLNSALGKDAVNQALNTLLYENYRLLDLKFNPEEFEGIYPAKGSVTDDFFCISGILKKKSGSIAAVFGTDLKNSVTRKFYVTSVKDKGCVESQEVSKLWAAEKIKALSENYAGNREEIINTAKKFSIVTKDTSLIVLETLNDYIRYKVTPPEELRSEYDRIISRFLSSEFKKEGKGKIPAVVFRCFEEFKNWWNKSPEDFKKEKDNKKYSDTSALTGTRKMATVSVRASATNEHVMAEDIDMMYERADEREALPARSLNAKMAPAAAPVTNVKEATVVLQAWNSGATYISELKKTETEKMYDRYLELKKQYSASPAFCIECADYFRGEGLKAEALRILSNLAEMDIENTDVLRAFGNKLSEWKEYNLAAEIFKKLSELRSSIPQFLRDTALALNNAGRYQEACDTLWLLVSKEWDSRYSEIQQTALNDLNAIIALTGAVNTEKYDKRLLQNFDVDVRVVLTWNTDDCDIDLWVTDPDGEKCFYGNRLTGNGGRMSRDFTQGYGPEEFAIKLAPGGEYKIQCNYYASHQQKLLQPVIVQAEVYTNFGRKNQTCQLLPLQLNDVKNTFDIGKIAF